MRIGDRAIQDYTTPYVIAEVGANHNGDMDLAKELVEAAKRCGCDAVKFQSWTPDSLISRAEYERHQRYDDSPKKHFGSLREMVEKYYLRRDQHFELKAYCDEVGIDFCSTPFSEEEVDLLEALEVKFYKVASMDINNLGLLGYIADKRRPVVLSTGMSTLAEIETALDAMESRGNDNIVLLHCVSVYPPRHEEIHLNNIETLRRAFLHPVGFSDHTIGTTIPLASVALGSCLIEKHFTLDKEMPGWDHEISADPGEMTAIVEGSREICAALGSSRRRVSRAEAEKLTKFRRSVVLNKDLNAGSRLGQEDLAFKRPGTGIRPDEAAYVVGRRLKSSLSSDDLVEWDDLD